MLSIEEVKQIPPEKLLEIIDSVRAKVKKSDVIKDLFDKYNMDLDELDLIPMCFADIDVSATTNHGIIYFNYKLLCDGDFENDDHYMSHELTHFCQQCFKPTQSSDDGNYLDNKYEQEGFQNQTKYLSETRNDETAENYIEMVLDHHDVKGKEREKRKDKLLELAATFEKEQNASLQKISIVKKEPKGYVVRSEKGKKLSRFYKSRKAAQERLKMLEALK